MDLKSTMEALAMSDTYLDCEVLENLTKHGKVAIQTELIYDEVHHCIYVDIGGGLYRRFLTPTQISHMIELMCNFCDNFTDTEVIAYNQKEERDFARI